MFKKNKMSQEAGHSSQNYQAGGNITVSGVSYSEAKDIAQQVFDANFYKLSIIAKEKAVDRAQNLIDCLLSELFKIDSSGMPFNDPGFQISVYEAQRAYAKTGDEELKKNLIYMLIERSKEDKRTSLQIILDEALLILPKLTSVQIDFLTFLYLLTVGIDLKIENIESFESHIKDTLMIFYNERFLDYDFIYAMTSSGAISRTPSFGYKTIQGLLKYQFQGFFSKGASYNDILKALDGNRELITKYRIMVKNIRDLNGYQINATNKKSLESKLNPILNEINLNKILDFYDKTTMNDEEIFSYVVSLSPRLAPVFQYWNSGQDFINHFQLNVSGTAIAVMNFSKKTKQNINFEQIQWW